MKRLLIVASMLFWPLRLWACAACSCGDPTLSAVGAEKPYQGRLRLSLDARYRTDSVGRAGIDKLTLRELKTDIQAAWSPSTRLTLMATLPVGTRSVTYANTRSQNTAFVGDAELRGKVFVWQERTFDPNHLLALLGGLSLPTGTALAESFGKVPLELGVSLDVATVSLGAAYAGFARPWSLYASAVLASPLATTREGDRPARSLRGTVSLQHQTWATLALRASGHVRVDGVAMDLGTPDPNSGGKIFFAGPEALWSPGGDLTFFGYARLPVASGLRGAHDEGPIFGAGVAWDP